MIDNVSEWEGMPEFIQRKIRPFKKCSIFIESDSSIIFIRFDTEQDFLYCKGLLDHYDGNNFYVKSREALSERLDQKITNKTKSIWHPFKSHWGLEQKEWITSRPVLPRYPVYIISKGRWRNGLTTKALDEMGVPHYIVVESHEENSYKNSTNAKILVLPNEYLETYETCDNLGSSRSKGPGAARNFCIDHSFNGGFRRHWVMDDNIDAFHYLNRNEKHEVRTGATLSAAEDFTERYINVPVSGLNYYSFCKKNDGVPPFVKNTRIYSCLLIDNEAGYRWRGRYNEDTDLSLRVLKDGNCTLQFNAFLCGKVTTQRMKGGNTQEFYKEEGTLPKSQMLADLHPDVAKVVWKFNRWHHHVDYRKFKKNKLVINENIMIKKGVNNYGMTLSSEKTK